MSITGNIRQLYNPIQPTVKESAEHVTYQEFLPDPALQNYIYCYWKLQTLQSLHEPFYYRVVADGCIDIFFELNNPEESYVMGFCKNYTEFLLENTFNYVGVRFLPTMFPQLFKIDASELSNRYESLNIVLPGMARFITECFSVGTGAAEIKAHFDQYFLKLLAGKDLYNDPRLYNAVSIILKNNGLVHIEKDLDTGISPRQLRRLFQFYVGDSAKTFSKIVRFQNILRDNPSQQNLKAQKLFFDNYYDQAHFIKEFKTFYGTTPGQAFE
ncbi:helix-turn-helix domain-containing protein [Dyadobacter sp. CY323]|uniref:AraC family transcriptional regulator n=1 Tax=Dyadobacter sp. CY323 TaxID=2907302 RepID=UPI001F3CCDDC|nr:helix-turn-helix domain-containing protein [Dyadobacter sp. CY323]MCE6991307.1 helix-turn-helix domain-containing protein [Dyadobacter sp. CY323]